MNESFIDGMAVSTACMIIGHILCWLSDVIRILLIEYREKRKEMKD